MKRIAWSMERDRKQGNLARYLPIEPFDNFDWRLDESLCEVLETPTGGANASHN
jgi:hypothetical protein